MGQPVAQKGLDEKFCGDCASAIKIKAEICPKCGVRQLTAYKTEQDQIAQGKSKVAAILLCLLLGGFGAHKFYLGQVGSGILYLIFCWTFIPAIVSIVELILLIVMDDRKFREKYR